VGERLLPRARASKGPFGTGRLPPLRDLSRFVAAATYGVLGAAEVAWEEVGLEVAAEVTPVDPRALSRASSRVSRGGVARVTESVRTIEADPAAPLSLRASAADTDLSPFHYLRTFERVTGVSPSRYRTLPARRAGEPWASRASSGSRRP
jgi:hypothetical protein